MHVPRSSVSTIRGSAGREFRPYGRAWVYCPAERKVCSPSRKKADVMAPSDRKLFGSRASHECIIRRWVSLEKDYPCFANFNDAEFTQ